MLAVPRTLLFIGVPVAFSLAGLGAALLLLKGLPLAMVAQNLHGALDNFVLLSVPLFLLMRWAFLYRRRSR